MSDDDAAEERDGTGIADLAARYAEPDPEADLPNPETELPSVPEPPTPADADVPSELRFAFWSTVVVFNVALLALSVGVMLIAFDGRWSVGAALVAVGLLSFARGYRRYRTYDGRDWREGTHKD